MFRLTLLGVGTAVPDQDRENTHMVVDAADGMLLIDCGGSTFQRLLRAGLDPLRLRGVLLTHGHADHINGLPVLLFSLMLAGYQGRLPVYGNAATIARMQRIVAAFELEAYQVPVDWTVVNAGDEVPLNSPHYRLTTAETVHALPALALRFATPDGRALVYSADTEPCDAVQQLARNAAVLIHEATTAGPFAGHTSPAQAGQIAARAGAEKLVLVHFSPRYTMSVADAIDAVRTAGFTGEAEVGREFDTYSL